MNSSIEEADKQYVVHTKVMNDIIKELNVSAEDEILYSSIITGIEKNAAKYIKEMKTVQLPLIGSIRINPVKRKLRDTCNNFKLIRKALTKEQYKDYIRNYVNKLKKEQVQIDRDKLNIKRIKSNNKDKYELLFRKLGKAYADMFLYSIYLLKEVPFDYEWEEQYQMLKEL